MLWNSGKRNGGVRRGEVGDIAPTATSPAFSEYLHRGYWEAPTVGSIKMKPTEVKENTRSKMFSMRSNLRTA